MAQGQRLVSDVLRIMRRAISRQNTNDPDSNDQTLFTYLNDFISLSMTNDLRIVEQFGTLSFNISEASTDGVYTFNDVGADSDFISLSNDAYISLLDPENNSLSWNKLTIYTNPGEFFGYWGINNEGTLIAGFPTEVLFYGNEFTFRTIPDTDYIVNIYGYKKNNNFDDISDPIQYDYWLRYLAYGAAVNYSRDFNFSEKQRMMIYDSFVAEKNLMLTNTHNRIKNNRCIPSF